MSCLGHRLFCRLIIMLKYIKICSYMMRYNANNPQCPNGIIGSKCPRPSAFLLFFHSCHTTMRG